jgi:hypothetical protein
MTDRRTWNWPAREEWAKQRRSTYWDSETGCPFGDRFGHRLSDYATPKEIEAAIAAVKALVLEDRRAKRADNLALGALGRHRGESARAYDKPLRSMSREEREIVFAGWRGEYWPYELRGILKELQNDAVPPWRSVGGSKLPSPLDLIMARKEAAYKAAENEWEQEMAIFRSTMLLGRRSWSAGVKSTMTRHIPKDLFTTCDA